MTRRYSQLLLLLAMVAGCDSLEQNPVATSSKDAVFGSDAGLSLYVTSFYNWMPDANNLTQSSETDYAARRDVPHSSGRRLHSARARNHRFLVTRSHPRHNANCSGVRCAASLSSKHRRRGRPREGAENTAGSPALRAWFYSRREALRRRAGWTTAHVRTLRSTRSRFAHAREDRCGDLDTNRHITDTNETRLTDTRTWRSRSVPLVPVEGTFRKYHPSSRSRPRRTRGCERPRGKVDGQQAVQPLHRLGASPTVTARFHPRVPITQSAADQFAETALAVRHMSTVSHTPPRGALTSSGVHPHVLTRCYARHSVAGYQRNLPGGEKGRTRGSVNDTHAPGTSGSVRRRSPTAAFSYTYGYQPIK